MSLITAIIVLLLSAYLATLMAPKLKIPKVVALILMGILMGIPVIKKSIFEQNLETLFNIGDFALLCLMFLAGLESSWQQLYSEKKDALIIAFLGFMFPLILGFTVFKFIGFSLKIALVVGISMSITAEATRARVLLEINKLKTKIGAAIMGAGIIDDLLGLLGFSIVTYFLAEIPLAENLFIAEAIFAFFAGVLIETYIKRTHMHVQKLEKILLNFVVPFFFLSIGLHFDMKSLIVGPQVLLLMLLIGFSGKFLGAFSSKAFLNLKWKQLYLIGWAMNSRGAIGMALALIALRTNLIPIEIYSALVIMALTTTITFPLALTRIIKRNPKIMD